MKEKPTKECKHEKVYYCLKTGGPRCKKCKGFLEPSTTPRG